MLHSVEQIAAVGTMCLREAANSEEFRARAREALGLVIEVIDGEEEARLSYLAIISGLPLPQGVVAFDAGGGSTEFIVGAAVPSSGVSASTWGPWH